MTIASTRNLALLVAAAVTGAAALAAPTSTAHAADEKEKCYGVAKAGQNDCQTPTSSCAGTSKMDGEKAAFILVPKGTCAKIVGSSPQPM
ncbi:DUF2282 domain-containing protein [Caenispirillum bisanense]|uniref:Uncharacterized membrane protein n=1 Tax=Caenispirillum bisanense TaxID=414052 RepID=A0A286GG95_9PROT|nr:DUF2282 domain-containing protein [Caenispirillum bisanense]SOD94555.1 Uncharacterized membrane protein [Caenispirillum bisanense]